VETTQPNRLKEIREKRGLSQDQLADQMDVSQQQVHRWEQGDLKMSVVTKAARALDCAEQDLFGPPANPSTFGYTSRPGDLPAPDASLLGQIIGYVDAFLAEEGLELDADRKGTVVASLYQLAHRDAVARGIKPEAADLSPFDNVIKLAV